MPYAPYGSTTGVAAGQPPASSSGIGMSNVPANQNQVQQSPPTVFVIGGSPLVDNSSSAIVDARGGKNVSAEKKSGNSDAVKSGDNVTDESDNASVVTSTTSALKKKERTTTAIISSTEEESSAEESSTALFRVRGTTESSSVSTMITSVDDEDGGNQVVVTTTRNPSTKTEVIAATRVAEDEENAVNNNNNITPSQSRTSSTLMGGRSEEKYSPVFPANPPPNQTNRYLDNGGKGRDKSVEKDADRDADDADEEYYEDEEAEMDAKSGGKKRTKKRKWKAAASSKLFKEVQQVATNKTDGDDGIFKRRDRFLRRLKKKNFRRFKRVSNGKGGPSGSKKRCNSMKLFRVLSRAMLDQLSIAKQLIRHAAEKAFPDQKFDVICSSEGDFSYSFYARQYCEVERNGITCVAFD